MASEALWRKTPLIESSALSKTAGCRILLKLENLQPSGSFKSRGIGNYMHTYMQKHAQSNPSPHFYSASGGNAGLACVVAAAHLGHPATVVVPMTTKPMMIEKIRLGGAREVIQYGKSWREADEYLRMEILKRDEAGVYVPPFDHEAVWEGNATMVEEIVEQLGELMAPRQSGATKPCRMNGSMDNSTNDHPEVLPCAIVCSVGGGGLLCGVMRGLERIPSGSRTQVVAVETTGAASLFQSIAAKELVTLPGITSAATSLGATRVAEKAFEFGKYANLHSVTMGDADAEEGCLIMADCERLMLELACGVNVAMCKRDYLEKALGGEVRPEDAVVIVVCGGSNVTVDMLAGWKKDLQRTASVDGKRTIQVLHGKDF